MTPNAQKPSASPMKQSPYMSGGKTDKPKINEYYQTVSHYFHTAKLVAVLLLVLFIIITLSFSRSEITLENLQYLLKFISFTNTETSITVPKINYSTSTDTHLALFLSDLCYLSPDGYAVYDSKGNTIMTDNLSYISPMIAVGEKYVLCYDLGGTGFSIYNTFVNLHAEVLEYAITDGDIADDGSFAIATSTREYRTAVFLYDTSFRLVSRVLRDSYLMDLRCTDSGEVAIMTTDTENGSFVTTLELVSAGEEIVRQSVTLPCLGYALYRTDIGWVVISDDGITYLDDSLTIYKKITLASPLIMCDCSGKYLTCVCQAGIIGNTYSVLVYDNETAKQNCQLNLNGKLSAISHDESGRYIFILAGNEVTRINLVNRKSGSVTVEAGSFDILAQSSDSFILALGSYAVTCTPKFSETYFE